VNTPRDDRIHPLTRIVAAIVFVVLLVAFFALYIEPDHTDIDFAWTILPRTSAILIGAGYTAGAFFFARLLSQKKWHRVQAGFLPITAFTICMFIATMLHLGRFHQGALAFYLWTGIYAVTPILVPFVWWRNHSTDPGGIEENDLRFSLRVRWGLGVLAGIGILAMLVMFFRPSILISLAPWKLTELTARVFAGWSLLTLAALLSIAWDGRWSATRILLESALVAIVLTLLGLPRIWGDLDLTQPMAYVFVGGVILTLIVFTVIHLWLDKSSHRSRDKESQPIVEELKM
jgi:hypothetical protein